LVYPKQTYLRYYNIKLLTILCLFFVRTDWRIIVYYFLILCLTFNTWVHLFFTFRRDCKWPCHQNIMLQSSINFWNFFLDLLVFACNFAVSSFTITFRWSWHARVKFRYVNFLFCLRPCHSEISGFLFDSFQFRSYIMTF